MELSKYGNLMKLAGKQKYFSIRKSIALHALKYGIKPTARKYTMSKNTVRLWLRRFQKEGHDGLIDRRNGPDHIPHKTSRKEEKQIIEIRSIAPCYGAMRLKVFFDLKPSIGAIARILRNHGLTRKVRRKYQKKNDLRAIKAQYSSFSRLQMDIKYLTDIPPYWEQMMSLKLPRYQYTVRDVKSGMLFLGYHVILSIQRHLSEEILVQTDNGGEFSGMARHYESNTFVKAVHAFGAEHRYIPPGMCNANADVESIHATIEHEFYNLTQFSSREDFFRKAESYRSFYNLERPNYSKGAKTPWLIAQQDHPNNNLTTAIQFTKVIDLDYASRHALEGQPFPVLSALKT
jgi:transposase